jgi:hypothetical protein
MTGAHSMKAGYSGAFYWDKRAPARRSNLAYRVNNGVLEPADGKPAAISHGYARQDERALRAGHMNDRQVDTARRAALRPRVELLPGAATRSTRFLPNPILFPETQGVIRYNDIDPRLGIAADLRGNGKTALKFNVGRYSNGRRRQQQLLGAASLITHSGKRHPQLG